jgi:hypothetical protein
VQEPIVATFNTMHGVIETYADISSVDCTLEIAVNVAGLVGFCHKIMEIPHRDSTMITSEVRIIIKSTTNIVNL